MLDLKNVYTPSSLEEALALMAEQKLRPLAGGTDLVVDLRNKVLDNTSVVALGRIEALRGIRREGDSLCIGALTTFTEIINSELIASHAPVLAEAARTIAGPQIRNAATIGGNVANGAVSADSIPSLLVYDAVARIQSVEGTREVPLQDIFTGPGKTNLKQNELLTGLLLPVEELAGLKAHYIKYSVRKSMDLAVLGVAVGLSVKDGVIERLRCALGVAAPVPLRLLRDADWAGRQPDEALVEEILAEIERSIQLRDSWRASKEYREHLVRVLIRDAFRHCLAQTEGIKS